METQNKYRLLLWLAVIVVLVAVVFAMIKLVRNTPGAGETAYTDVLSSITSADWAKDNLNASTTLVEYSDFECPACASFFPVLQEIHKQLGNDIKFVYRHFPLPQHVNARIASRAAEAAGKQGKFWEMHDMLFAGQKSWTAKGNAEEIFAGYAQSLGLDVEQFKKDLRSKEIGEKIDDHIDSGKQFNVASTPTFYLNNKKIEGFRSFQEFFDIVKNEATKK